jgi:putative transposase
MPRTRRREFANAIHHVTGKAPSRRLLFVDDADHRLYLQLLAREIRERGWRLMTYCQLSNHLHLLVQTPEPDLGAGLKRVHEDFARQINARRAEGGHLFGARFHNGVVTSDRHVQACIRYIARNPVDAGICRHPRQWPWSAHGALAGLTPAPSFLDIDAAYAHLGINAREARIKYVELVAKSNSGILADLSRPESDEWLVAARDEFAIPVDDIATFLGVSRATAYRRLTKARENEGTVPSFSFETVGTDP